MSPHMIKLPLAVWLTLVLTLLVPAVARSEPNQTTVDCTDDVTAIVCSECYLSGDDCLGCESYKLDCLQYCATESPNPATCPDTCPSCDDACGTGFCCGDAEACDVVTRSGRPPLQLLPLGLKAVVGPVTLVFQRKGMTNNNQAVVAIKLQESVKFSGGKKSLTVKTMLTGADAVVGSLLYPVAFLANGQNALNLLQSHGYDVSLAGTTPTQTCQGISSQTECSLHAAGLAHQLDAMLAAAGDPETGAFEAGLQMLAGAAFGGTSTTTTTTTSSTTSTTPCPTGQSDCSGTCVNLMSDNNNCGSCGNVCTTLPVCIGGVCTIP